MSPDDLLAAAEIALPALTVVVIAGTAFVTWLIAGETARRRGRTIRALRSELAEADRIIARLTDPAAELLADVHGTHHKEESRG